MLGFDGSQSAADCGRHFDDLDLVAGPQQASTAHQSGEPTPDDDDRCHLDHPQSGLCKTRGFAGTREPSDPHPEQWVFVDGDESGSRLIHGRLGSRE